MLRRAAVQRQIELRVRQASTPRAEPMELEPDTMLDAWVEFPFGEGKLIRSHLAETPDWPDVPIIPSEDLPQ